MIVEDKRSEIWKPLEELKKGDCFEHDSDFYIYIDDLHAVCLETGQYIKFVDPVTVRKVVAKITIYEEYYEDEEYEKLI